MDHQFNSKANLGITANYFILSNALKLTRGPNSYRSLFAPK